MKLNEDLAKLFEERQQRGAGGRVGRAGRPDPRRRLPSVQSPQVVQRPRQGNPFCNEADERGCPLSFLLISRKE